MIEHWKKIGFVPSDFKGPDSDDDVFTDEVIIKESNVFTPPHRQPNDNIEDDSQHTGVVIKNLPANIPENEVIEFLTSKGLPDGHPISVLNNPPKNTNVDVEDLEKEACKALISILNGKRYFNKTVYCRGLKNLHTPPKENKEEKSDKSPALKNPPEIKIPGLPDEDIKKAKIKSLKALKLKEKLKKKEDEALKLKEKLKKKEELSKKQLKKKNEFLAKTPNESESEVDSDTSEDSVPTEDSDDDSDEKPGFFKLFRTIGRSC